MRTHNIVVAGLILILAGMSTMSIASPRDGWNFKMKDFIICAWYGPDGTDAEVQVYKECGFNAVMVGRYMTAGEYCQPDEVQRQLDLAHKYKLKAFLDTYTRNNLPWGGISTPYTGNGHHNATPNELELIHKRFGKHPALIGYMIGDDQGNITEQTGKNTDFLHRNAPYLMPWICGWVPAEDLAKHNNPIMDPQIYPTLNDSLSADVQAQYYSSSLQTLRQNCRKYDLIPWPMFNVEGVKSDSMIRYQVYSSIAYGAQAIWYFSYRDNTGEFGDEKGSALCRGTEGKRGATTYEAAKEELRPAYYDARECNMRIHNWSSKILGRVASEIYYTGWKQDGEDVFTPSESRLVVSMSDNLLVGILTKPGAKPLAMVVDKRVSKDRGAFPARNVEITFGKNIKMLTVLEDRHSKKIKGNQARFILPAGGGQLFELGMVK